MRRLTPLLLAAALILQPLPALSEPQGFRTGPIPLKPGKLSGLLSDFSGQGIGETRVDLLDGAGKVVASAATDKDGRFVVADLSAGEYTLSLGDGVALPLTVAENYQLSNLKIISQKDQKGGGNGNLLGYIIIGGVVVAVIVAGVLIPVLLLSGDGDGGGPPVSP